MYGRRKDGSLFPVEVGLNPFKTHDGNFVMASVLDISERIGAQTALQAKNEEIEQMVYAVSHDLKTPLVSIQGLSRLLKDINAVEDKETLEILDRIDKAAGQMGNLIGDLLEMSRVGHSSEVVERVDLSVVVADVQEMLSVEAERRNCVWRVEGEFPCLRASGRRVIQLVQNLVSNALKYGCDKGRNRVDIVGERLLGRYDLRVRDYGPGIDKRALETIFEPFTRFNSREEGTGIGLAIVSKIMKHYGGMASVESELGEGTCFTLTFPESMIDGAARGAAMLPQRRLTVQRATSELRRPEAKLPTDSEYLARFVYSAAHDFNAPIVTILGHLSYLREEHAAVLESEAISLLDYSIEAASRMGEYLRMLSQFSAVLRGRTEGEWVDMNALMGEVWAAAPSSRSKELAEVRWRDLPEVRADRSMLRLLLVHLLDNSLKFVETGMAPKVRIEAEDGPSEWFFSFADEGIGIESSARESVFVPFRKQHSHSRYPGSGIGLAICQKVVEAHRGVIWIEPNEPRGVVVRFTLPKT